jgi:hypothetical protein
MTANVLRSGHTRRLLGGWIAAPSTLGTFLRAFTFGHVRQLDRLLGEALTRPNAFSASVPAFHDVSSNAVLTPLNVRVNGQFILRSAPGVVRSEANV